MNSGEDNKSLKEKILDIHEQIENELDFIIDADTRFTDQYFDILDNVDAKFISVEQDTESKIITLFQTEEDGLLYLKDLETLLFLIRKYGLKINLKKLKLLLRRKRSKKEVIYLFSLLQQRKEFFLKNKEEYSIEDQKEIENTILTIENIVASKKEEDYIVDDKDSKIIDSPLGTMVGMTLAVPTLIADGLLPKNQPKVNDVTDKRIIENYFNQNSVDYYQMRKDFVDNNFKKTNNLIEDLLISEPLKDNIQGNISPEIKQDIKIDNLPLSYVKQNNSKEIVNSKLVDEGLINEEIQNQEEDLELEEDSKSKLDNTIKIVGTTLAGAGLVAAMPVVVPTAFKAAVIGGAAKMLLDDSAEEIKEEVETLREEKTEQKSEIEELKAEKEELLEEKEELQQENEEIQELITTLEEANEQDIRAVQEDPELNSEQAERERYEAMKISFENMRQEEQFKLRNEQIKKAKQQEKQKQEDKQNNKQRSSSKSPFANFMKKVGKTTFLFAMNIAVATAIANPLVFKGPVKKLTR